MQRKIHAILKAENRPLFLKDIKKRVNSEQVENALSPMSTTPTEAEKIGKTPVSDRSLHYALNALIRDGYAQKVVFMTPDKPAIGYASRTDVDTLIAFDGKLLREDYNVKVTFGVCPRDPTGPYQGYLVEDRVLMVHMNRIHPSKVS